MPIPLLFIGAAAASTMLGVGNTVKAGIDTVNAKNYNKTANTIQQQAHDELEAQRKACATALQSLGTEKLFVLNHNLKQFLDTFTRIKNVDFQESIGLDELDRMHIDQQDFQEMENLVSFAGSIAGGAAAGTASGVLTVFGAYGAAQALASASTGTAIAALHGAAATNATLAFFGGGSLAAGGLGMAGGAAVLGGLMVGPALMVMGFVVGGAAKQNLTNAQSNLLTASEACAELNKASAQCSAIRRRTYMLYTLLARLDSYFLPMIYKMEEIVQNEGENYALYSRESKGAIASCVSVAVSVKSVLDTPLLTDDGLLTEASANTSTNIEAFLQKLKIPY